MATSTPGMGSADYGSGPRLTVVKGQPDADEIAAIAAVLTALSRPARTADPHRTHRNPWSSPARRLREPLARSAGGWRDSRLPR
jgi:Acyl-CoA carboxylase epsilon subunit